MKLSKVRAFVAATVATACFGSGYVLAAAPVHTAVSAHAAAPKDLGRVNPSTPVNLTVVLKPHNEAEYDQAVDALFDPTSPTYHKWFTDADFEKYAPTQAEFNLVKNELVGQGFTVVSSDPNRFSLRVHSTVGTAQAAFQTEVHTYSLANGHTYQGTTRTPALAGSAGALVKAVAGLERHQARPRIVFQKNPVTNTQIGKKTLAEVQADGGVLALITGTPLTASQSFTYTNTPSTTATYSGTVYDVDSSLVVSYSPQQLQAHYGLTDLISQGYDGTGQTIALVEAYGYDAAESDANLSAQTFGLPPLTSDNFSVVYPEGPPLNPDAAELTGWNVEIALDIQSAHGIAPGAKIVVVASAGQDNEDQIASLQYIIDHKVANTVSSSWENDDEIIAGTDELNAFNSVLKKGAAAGISFQFSSGDSGDLGLGTPVGAVAVPSDSPYAVAVGGTSILNNPYGSGDIVTGWGTAESFLAATVCILGGPSSGCTTGAVDPPTTYFFYAGAGGGQSQYFAKPKWQSALPGSYRQVPDVSALADPFTGFPIFVTQSGLTFFEPGYGGTSLASPIFTAIWAIADQYHGKPLGSAAPLVAALHSGQITDVVPTSPLNQYNLTGSITDANGTTSYTSTDLFAGLLYNTTAFTTAIFPLDSTDALGLSFGLDTSLTVTPGWDNVTGYGEPNGMPFIQGVSQLAGGGGGHGGHGADAAANN